MLCSVGVACSGVCLLGFSPVCLLEWDNSVMFS